MKRPPLLGADSHAVLPPQYFGSVGYYAVMCAYGQVTIDTAMRHDKRFKSTHRCHIEDTRGPLALTAAVSHNPAKTWADMEVSTHGRWWHVHRVSLESAYGRTPFFEFYADRLAPIFADREVTGCESITKLCERADSFVRQALQLPCRVSYAPARCEGADDLRRYDFSQVPAVPYYQSRTVGTSFSPGLSILDLLFNMGPESAFVLTEMADLWLNSTK